MHDASILNISDLYKIMVTRLLLITRESPLPHSCPRLPFVCALGAPCPPDSSGTWTAHWAWPGRPPLDYLQTA